MGETVTVLLRKWNAGDSAALDEVVPLIYGELKKIAAAYVAREPSENTYSPTDLVAEAYERLATQEAPEWADRVHFFAVAARHMRQILIERARQRCAASRDGRRPVALDDTIIEDDRPEDLVALDDALAALAAIDDRKEKILVLHYFGGMTPDEIAAALELDVATITRELKLAIAWLNVKLGV